MLWMRFHWNHVPKKYELLSNRSKAENTGVFNACLFGLNPKYFFMRSTRALRGIKYYCRVPNAGKESITSRSSYLYLYWLYLSFYII